MITLRLTRAEAEGLRKLADAGRSDLFDDEHKARGYIGTKTQQDAAWRGFEKLHTSLKRHRRAVQP